MWLKTKIGPNGEFYKPTIHPTPDFNAEADAEALYKAMKGLGTDENAISTIIGKRTSEERIEIASKYKSLYGKDLMESLRSELNGDYEKLVLACMRTAYRHLAYSCYKAMAGGGTDEETLTQILVSSTNEEIDAIKEEYQNVLIEHNKDPNQRNLEKDILNDCGGHYSQILIAIIQGDREEPTESQMKEAQTKGVRVLFDIEKAKQQAEELYNAGEGKLGTDECTFIKNFVTQSVWQVAAIDLAYQKLTNKTLVEAIESEMSGDFGKAMKLVDRPSAYAKLINRSMSGAGTDENALIRLIATRADIDLQSIKEAYQSIYGKSMADDIRGDTGGDFEKLLLMLLGEN